ncbi:MAG: hypothetical protein FJX22_02840 [Alphaproteobacteria bacterium]|nr:hypothetical protein [Alphaproteobacteria bacterium]
MENFTDNRSNAIAVNPSVLPSSKLVWLLLDGWPERDQLLWAVAESLAQRQAVTVIPKKLRFNWLGDLPTGGLFRPLLKGLNSRLFGASLANLTSDGAMAITRPWPDVVLSAGSSTIPIARWIKRRMRTDRLSPRLIHLGQVPNGRRDFDLVMANTPDPNNLVDQIAALLNPGKPGQGGSVA